MRLGFGDGFGQLPPDVEGNRRDQHAEQEGNPPAPGIQCIARERRGKDQPDTGAHDRGKLLAIGLPRRQRGALLRRCGLEQVRRRRTDLAAARESLNQPREDEQDRRRNPDLRVGRRQRDHQRADRHQQQRERQRSAAADAIGIRTDDRRAQRPRHEPDAKCRQCSEEPANLGVAREERVADHHREEGEHQEVVELEKVADDNGDDRFHRQRSRRDRGARRGRRHGHGA